MFQKLTDPHMRSSVLVDLSSALHADNDAESLSEDDNADEALPDSIVSKRLSPATLHAFRVHSSDGKVARILPFYTVRGRTFSRRSRHIGNSSVIVKRSTDLAPAPAQIEDIIQTTSGAILFAVRYFGAPTCRDPFDQYPVLGISLWTAPQDFVIIVSPDHVAAHFAAVEYPTSHQSQHFAVIDLSRVRM